MASSSYSKTTTTVRGPTKRQRYMGGNYGTTSSSYKPRRITYSRIPRYVPTVRRSVFPAETKYFDCGINATVTSGAADWTDSEVPCDNYVNSSGTAASYTDSCLIPTAIGSGYGQVNGNRYHLKKFRCRGSLTASTISDQADVPATKRVRLMLVMDMQPNGSQAQGEDVMQDVGAGETIYSYRRIAGSSGRFRILKDMIYTLAPSNSFNDHANAMNSTGSVGWERINFSFQYTPRKPITVNITSAGSTPAIAQTITCNIFMLLMTVGEGINISAASRAYYCD